MKATKKSLFACGVSLLACFTMLLGTTFAWFTDSVSNKGNRIQAGNLQVQLFKYSGGAADVPALGSGWNEITNQTAAAAIFDAATFGSFAPGDEKTIYLAVKNGGTLPLRYNLDVVVNDASLTDALLFGLASSKIDPPAAPSAAESVAGQMTDGVIHAAPGGRLAKETVEYISLTVKMSEGAGNTYQGAAFDADINLTATQDNDAAEAVKAYTAADIQNAEAGRTVVLMRDILAGTDDLVLNRYVNLDLAGHTLYVNSFRVEDAAGSGTMDVAGGLLLVNSDPIVVHIPKGTCNWSAYPGLVSGGTVTKAELETTTAAHTFVYSAAALDLSRFALPEGVAKPAALPAPVIHVKGGNVRVSEGAQVDTIAVAQGNTTTTSINNEGTIGKVSNATDQPVNVNNGAAGSVGDIEGDVQVDGLTPWDGTSSDTAWYAGHEGDAAYTLSTPAQLKGLADLCDGGNTFAGKTIRLGADISLNKKEWNPIGEVSRKSGEINGTAFAGTFDGQGHTVAGLAITTTTGGDDGVGLFSGVTGTVKSVNFSAVNIQVPASAMLGTVAGGLASGGSVQNCKVLSGTVSGFQGVGGIAGRILESGSIADCSNAATVVSSVSGGYNVGGIVGAAYYQATFTGGVSSMQVKNCVNTGAVSGPYGVGGIVGLSATADIAGCTNQGAITGNGASVGGIAGEQQNGGSITRCVNSGAVRSTAGVGSFGTGGIVGWIRYSGNEGIYPSRSLVTVADCVNNGAITASNMGIGGIAGEIYHGAKVTGNTNTGNIQGGAMVGGVVGSLTTTDALAPTLDKCAFVLTGNTSTATELSVSHENNIGTILGHYSGHDSGKCSNGASPYATVSGNSAAAVAGLTDGLAPIS